MADIVFYVDIKNGNLVEGKESIIGVGKGK